MLATFAAWTAHAGVVQPSASDSRTAVGGHHGPSTIVSTALAIKSVLSAMEAKKSQIDETSIHHTVAPTHTVTAPTAKASAARITRTRTRGRPEATRSSRKHNFRRAVASATPAGSNPTATSPGLILTTGSVAQAPLSPTDPCGPISYAYGYVPSDPSMSGFLSDNSFYATSMNATTPSGYNWLYGGYYSALNQDGYLGYVELSSYNVSFCAAYCDATSGCRGFDIYNERDPAQNPAVACLNPAMKTAIRCAFYSTPVNNTNAINVGQWRGNFGVVIAGANGYNKNVPAPAPVAPASHFTILSAFLATEDITLTAQASFLQSNQLVINTTYTPAAYGPDPWAGNNLKVISILYTYKNETRVFTAFQNTGVYVQQDAFYSPVTAPDSTLVPGYTAPAGSNINIAAVVYGGTQITAPSVFATLYNDHTTGTSVTVSSSVFGLVPLLNLARSTVVWYYTSTGLKAVAAQDGATFVI
ncbi:hypothetical protein ANO11243_091870 [Dothideomycetidae sp. 11243]|nr:hypothetical protein ANO11243_091870 [fungal sp. No.11243]